MRLSLERFVFQRADVVLHTESNIMQSVKGEFCMALRGQIISQLGRAYRFLETSTSHQLEDGDGRMSGRQSDSFIVPRKLGNARGGKGAT